jgi:NADPH:quinone reductase-like Zn-dependent oxidoreductase
MPNAVVMTGYGPPEVLKWAHVPLPPDAVLGFEAAGTVDAAGTGVLADAVALAGGPDRVITLSDLAAADFGVTLSEPTPDRAPGALDETIAMLADGRLRLRAHQSMPMQQAADAHRQLESGNVHERIILTLN